MTPAGGAFEPEVLVEVATTVDENLVAEVASLMPQLSSSAPAPARAELEELLDSPSNVLFVARLCRSGGVVGMLTLVVYRIPTGINAVIEDVVVDESARGSGVGASLVRAALEEAERRGARHVDLTSRPSREAANRLYERLGFRPRATNVRVRSPTFWRRASSTSRTYDLDHRSCSSPGRPVILRGESSAPGEGADG